MRVGGGGRYCKRNHVFPNDAIFIGAEIWHGHRRWRRNFSLMKIACRSSGEHCVIAEADSFIALSVINSCEAASFIALYTIIQMKPKASSLIFN